MLKRFILNALSSFVGTWIALFLGGFAAVLLIIGVAARIPGKSEAPSVKKHSVFKIEVDGVITETDESMAPDFSMFLNMGKQQTTSLNRLVKALEEAADNKNISALYLECGAPAAGLATLDALRNAIIDFKKSGKPVIAYSDSYSMGSYFVATAADSVFLNPGGSVQMNGLASGVMYYKDLFDKLGVSFQVVKVGTFKSAVEPYILEHMSEPARHQLDTLLNNDWTYILNSICDQRKTLTADKINELVNTGASYASAASLKKQGIVDRAVYGRNINTILGDLVDEEADKLNIITEETLLSQTPWAAAYKSKNQVAVLYATGAIEDGSSRGINFETMVPEIVKLADDEDVKGLVLRVNSPGGSAYGSEQIGEALDYFKSKGKPLAVSMGDYAASGGYWISAGADYIFANPLTLTGSIGVFGLIPNVEKLTEKIGVNLEMVATNPQAQFPGIYKAMTPDQLAIMQKYVDRTYTDFVTRVAKGRNMSVEAVKKIAEGRVWDAQTAVKIGLVNKIGNLEDAVEWVAAKAEIKDDYDVAYYPEFEPSIWDMIRINAAVTEAFGEVSQSDRFSRFVELYCLRMLNQNPVQARAVEYLIHF